MMRTPTLAGNRVGEVRVALAVAVKLPYAA